MATKLDVAKRLRYAIAPPGMVFLWAAVGFPRNSVLCDGSALARVDYPDLFAAIGETFGAGDGAATFNVPNMPAPASSIRYFIASDFVPRDDQDDEMARE